MDMVNQIPNHVLDELPREDETTTKEAILQSLPEPREPEVEIKRSLEPLAIPQDMYSDENIVPSTPLLHAPSLRGRLFVEGTTHICRGVWAMFDSAHDQPGQTSEFEFRLTKPGEGMTDSVFPKNGKYQGWFILKQAPPLKPAQLKVDDREMNMTFIKQEDGGYKVEGEGYNKFGSFSLRGHLNPDGTIQIYRYYSTKPVKKRTVSPSHEKPNKKLSSENRLSGDMPPPLSLNSTSQIVSRDGVGRVRKKTNFEFEETQIPLASGNTTGVISTANTPKTPKTPAFAYMSSKGILPTTPLARQDSGRSHRVPLPLQKCGELLKELSKQPHAVWFSEPVDPVKLNIPDYFTIIKQPMDFKTIRTNLENNYYATPEAFAEHMRLIFSNAIAYNVLKDNLVNIAAREMSSKFEEKYRLMLTQLAQHSSSVVLPEEVVQVQTSGSRKSIKPSYVRSSSGGSSFKRPSLGTAVGPHPPDIFLPPPLNPGAHYLADMQRRMEEMQNEIIKLRTAVRQTEVHQQIIVQRDAAHNPLTFEEKKLLISEINRLPEQKQSQVFEIIRSTNTLPHDADEDIEVPLDELDTLTLRKLQKFVEECNAEKRKRDGVQSPSNFAKKVKKEKLSTGPAPALKSSTKKVKTPQPAAYVPHSVPGFQMMSIQSAQSSVPVPEMTSNPFNESVIEVSSYTRQDHIPSSSAESHIVTEELKDEEEDLLFGSESFEVLRAHSYEYGSDNGSVMGEQEEEEEEDPPNNGQNNPSIQLANPSAWTTLSSSNNVVKNSGSSNMLQNAINTGNVSNGLWKDAARELAVQKQREELLRQEEQKLTELKLSHDNLKQPKFQESAKSTGVSNSQTIEPVTLDQRREEERRKIQSLAQTVNLDTNLADEEMRMLVESSD